MAASSSLKLTLRQKPHLDWISQGFAGLLTEPASGQARIEGTVEVRVVQQAAIAAAHVKLVKVELKKTETVLTSKGVRRYFEVCASELRRALNRIAETVLNSLVCSAYRGESTLVAEYVDASKSGRKRQAKLIRFIYNRSRSHGKVQGSQASTGRALLRLNP